MDYDASFYESFKYVKRGATDISNEEQDGARNEATTAAHDELIFFSHEFRKNNEHKTGKDVDTQSLKEQTVLDRLVGEIFFFHFFIVWALSFLSIPLFLYSVFSSRFPYFKIGFILITLHTYLPFPKHNQRFRRFIFLNVPKYFKSSSYRVLNPQAWPELRPIVRHCLERDCNRGAELRAFDLRTYEMEVARQMDNFNDLKDTSARELHRGNMESTSAASRSLSPESDQSFLRSHSHELLTEKSNFQDESENEKLARTSRKNPLHETTVSYLGKDKDKNRNGTDSKKNDHVHDKDNGKKAIDMDSIETNKYKPAVLRKPGQLETRCRIWLFHPHGLHAFGWGLQAWNPFFHKIKNCVSTLLYIQPPIIWYTSLCGHPSSVRASTIKNHLKQRESVAIIPGGYEEAAIHPNYGDRIYLKNRGGIFSYALRFGADLVPTFVFGETKSFSNIQGAWDIRLWLCRRSIPTIFPVGRNPFLWWMPKDDMLHVVVGNPIQVDRVNAPVTTQQVEELQTRYIDGLKALYNQYKKQFYGEDFEAELEIW